MKKKLITISLMVFGITQASVVYHSIVQNNKFEVGGFKTVIDDSGWYNIGQPSCTVDILPENVYFNRDFNQTESCSQNQEKIVTTKRVWDSGDEEIVKVEKYTQEIKDDNIYALVGTHIENTCLDILNNGYSDGNNIYRIINGIDVYCDMTTNNGGWTLVFNHDISNGAVFSSDSESLNINQHLPSLETERYSILNHIENFRRNGKFEFRIQWDGFSEKNIWKQTSNPTYQAVAGYEPVSVEITDAGWGGLERGNSQHSFIDGSVNSNAWYYAIASRYIWGQNESCYGIPASDALAGYYCGVPNVNLWIK